MDNKMTSGEIAKKAGVSQKAVRLYDEKGLLKPTGYSEGNYRLYDQGALEILEKIVALKQIGFSLEEIRDNLTNGDTGDIREALNIQLQIMKDKLYQTEMVIDAITRTLKRKGDDLDWDDVADIVRNVSVDQKADRNHFEWVSHQVEAEDWYVRIFKSIEPVKDAKILDLGCGYAKIWRNSWENIPEGSKIFAYDLHGSWADDFAEYLEQNRKDLPSGVDIDLKFMDIEDAATWDKISENQKYDRIIAHYLSYELKDPESMVASAAMVLSPDGFFSINCANVKSLDLFFDSLMAECGVDAPFIKKSISRQENERDEFNAMLKKYFGRIEPVLLENAFSYSDAEDLLRKMKDTYPDQEKFFNANGKKIKAFFEEKISKDGAIVMVGVGKFAHCYL